MTRFNDRDRKSMTQTHHRRHDRERVYRIVAANPLRDDALVVEDTGGNTRLFLRSSGSVTSKPVNPPFLALLREHGWRTVNDSGWRSGEELAQAKI
jgi:hypothetical protein